MINEFDRRDVSPLRYWVHAILPLVYDDSLSYYEVLAKVSQKMNEVIDGLNKNNEQVEKVTQFTIDQVKNLTEAFNNFQQSMLDRQENFETKILDEQNSFEQQLQGDIANWEAETEEKFQNMYDTFSENVNDTLSEYKADYDQFKEDTTETLNQYKKDYTKWTTDTKADLESWKTDTENDLDSWKTTTESGLDTWKNDTKSDLDTWKNTTESGLESWKTDTKNELDQQYTDFETETTEKLNQYETNYNNWTTETKTELQNQYNTWTQDTKNDLDEWKSTTETGLESWKGTAESDIAGWKTTTESELENKFSEYETNTNKSLESWKTTTEAGLATWKNDTESDIDSWKNDTKSELDTQYQDFTTQTSGDLEAWKTTTESGLDDWKTNTEQGLASWKSTTESGLESWKTTTESGLDGWKNTTESGLESWKSDTKYELDQQYTDFTNTTSETLTQYETNYNAFKSDTEEKLTQYETNYNTFKSDTEEKLTQYETNYNQFTTETDAKIDEIKADAKQAKDFADNFDSTKIVQEPGQVETVVPSQKVWTNYAFNVDTVTDPDDITENGIYNLFGVDNLPDGIRYACVIHFNNVWGSNVDESVQILSSTYATNGKFYMRHKYANEWQPWTNLIQDVPENLKVVQTTGDSDTSVPSQKAWTQYAFIGKSGYDPDAITENGIYYIFNSDKLPDNIQIGTVIHFNFINSQDRVDDQSFQLLYSTRVITALYQRHKDRGAWSDWMKIQPDVVQQSGESETAVPSQKVWTQFSFTEKQFSNANNITENGVYYFRQSSEYSNLPNNTTSGSLLHFNKTIGSSQGNSTSLQLYWNDTLIQDNKALYFRTHYSDQWGDWILLNPTVPRVTTTPQNATSNDVLSATASNKLFYTDRGQLYTGDTISGLEYRPGVYTYIHEPYKTRPTGFPDWFSGSAGKTGVLIVLGYIMVLYGIEGSTITKKWVSYTNIGLPPGNWIEATI